MHNARYTDVGTTKKKKNFPFFTAYYAQKKREKRNFLCKVRHFVNFPKFTKSLRQYLGNLITNNEEFYFSFQKTDA